MFGVFFVFFGGYFCIFLGVKPWGHFCIFWGGFVFFGAKKVGAILNFLGGYLVLVSAFLI
jgi:hypothetical protein